MKVLSIIYHKNILSIYKKKWIDDCMNSLKNQTFKDFTIYELNYGSDDLNLCKEYQIKNKNKFFKKKFDNHADAMNFLFMKAIQDGFDVVFNNNLDDFNDNKRFEIQLKKMEEGYDIVSCNFYIVDEIGKIINKMTLSEYDINSEIKKEHNIICHPGVCFSRNFIKKNLYDGDELPKEDLLLWKRTILNFNFFICEDILVFYRKHSNQITTKELVKLKDLQEDLEAEELFKEYNIVIPQKINNNNNNKVDIIFNYNTNKDICKVCGEPKNIIKYNFCQKCNNLY